MKPVNNIQHSRVTSRRTRRTALPLILALGLALLGCLFPSVSPALAGDLRLLAGAGLRQPTDILVEEFAKETGIKVFVDYGGSGKLMTRFLASNKGDLFMPGSYFYIEKLEKKGQVVSASPIALHTPVVGVNRAQAARVKTLADLALPGLKVGLGDPKAMALGRLADSILERAGLAQKVAPNVKVRTATVKQLSLYVAQGYVDAGIISRADAFQMQDQVALVEIPTEYYKPDVIGVALLKTAADPRAAAKLQAFLASPHGREVFARFGFLPLPAQGH